ncbi:MAG: 3'-5' exonuclease [Edaphocola sp.]
MATVKKTDNALFHKILVVDIETVPVTNDWLAMPEDLRGHWLHKMNFLKLTESQMEQPADVFFDRAGIYAEFGKIVCIGMGYVSPGNGHAEVRLKAISHDDEGQLLQQFAAMLETFVSQRKEVVFCGHNIKEFDIPYICRRMLINGLGLPACLDVGGLKPWQVSHQDTLELWRFGDYKNYVSLDLLAAALGIPSSKGDIDGSQVAGVYWHERNLKRISEYCLRDVYTTALVYLKLKGWQDALPTAVYV